MRCTTCGKSVDSTTMAEKNDQPYCKVMFSFSFLFFFSILIISLLIQKGLLWKELWTKGIRICRRWCYVPHWRRSVRILNTFCVFLYFFFFFQKLNLYKSNNIEPNNHNKEINNINRNQISFLVVNFFFVCSKKYIKIAFSINIPLCS